MYRKVIAFLLTILVVIIIAGFLKPSHQKNVKAIVSQTQAETEHIPDAPSTETVPPPAILPAETNCLRFPS